MKSFFEYSSGKIAHSLETDLTLVTSDPIELFNAEKPETFFQPL